MSSTTRDHEAQRVRRNLNPHREARLAMLLYGREYSRQSGGSMDFYDGLSDGTKARLKRWCDELDATPRATHMTRPTGRREARGVDWPARTITPCPDAPFGSYLNHIALPVPPGLGIGGKTGAVGLDYCIAHEVYGLWQKGIRTRASCCGHWPDAGVYRGG